MAATIITSGMVCEMVIEYNRKELKISPKAFTKLVKLGTWWEKEFVFFTQINNSEWYNQHENDFLKRVGFL